LPRRYHSNISLKLSDYERVKKIAVALNCSLPEVIRKLVEYCEKHNCIEELRSGKATAIKVSTPTSPKPKEVSDPRPKTSGDVIIDLGAFGKFTLTQEEWELFRNTLYSCSEPRSSVVFESLPSVKLRVLFNKMYLALVVKYDVKLGMWIIDYNRFKRYGVL